MKNTIIRFLIFLVFALGTYVLCSFIVMTNNTLLWLIWMRAIFVFWVLLLAVKVFDV